MLTLHVQVFKKIALVFQIEGWNAQRQRSITMHVIIGNPELIWYV